MHSCCFVARLKNYFYLQYQRNNYIHHLGACVPSLSGCCHCVGAVWVLFD